VEKYASMLTMSIVIPAHNEEGSIARTVNALSDILIAENIPHEILVVNDHSTDRTAQVLEELSSARTSIRSIENTNYPGGYGFAVRTGLESFSGDAVCVVMADASDDPADVVRYYRKLEEGFDCVFGSRFMSGSKVLNYPMHKLIINRIANAFIRMLFLHGLNDTTNAFKCYRRSVIDGIQPILACHFNLTVELPLKAIVRGYSYAVMPIHWYGRTSGVSKLKIKEMGSRYLFIVLYVLLEKMLSRGDYRKKKKST
jgi:dolichol-phosphate mannosyltransferase